MPKQASNLGILGVSRRGGMFNSMQRHGKWQNQGLGDYIAIAMASFLLLSLTMWPLLALMNNGFSFPQQATDTQRMIAASISCVL
jgi:hypothetical protein